MNILVPLPLISFITSILPLLGSGGRFGISDRPHCTDSQTEETYKMIHHRFQRFFIPDCQKGKLIFQADRQGCLGALRWLQEKVATNNHLKRKIFRSVICTHRPCSKLPLFRRCGSNQTDHSNPRTFRNGCRQCATSCKAVLAGKRRYERLHMDKCYQKRKPMTPSVVESKPPDTIKTDPPGFADTQTTVAPAYNPLSFNVMQSTTTALTTNSFTTELMTTELATTQMMTSPEVVSYDPKPVRKVPDIQQCTVKQVACSIKCDSVVKHIRNVTLHELPKLPPWESGG